MNEVHYKTVYNMRTQKPEQVIDTEYGKFGKFSWKGVFRLIGYILMSPFRR